ncbi:MAG: flagellar filament capping protein FliD [Treponema sp.]|nr:flagellar filament capping protein FliD [Treponema sp.]
MAGLNIPGITDQYKTNETVEKLMQIERIPLTREQKQLDEYKAQKDAWREINNQLTSLRDSTKSLYSYENPFNSKITSSTEEYAVTAEASRSADLQSFKIDVIQPATADRFLSGELDSEYKVPQGNYIYKIGDKTVTLNWKGGSLKDFSNAINKRSNGIVKSMIIGSSIGKKTLLIEGLLTGKENKLIFEKDAKTFAESSGMISPIKSDSIQFGTSRNDISNLQSIQNSQTRMPSLSLNKVKTGEDGLSVSPRGACQINIPSQVKSKTNMHISLNIKAFNTQDITEELNKTPEAPVIPNAGFAEFEGITISNMESNTLLPRSSIQDITPLQPISNNDVLYAVMEDGSEKVIQTSNLFSENGTDIDLPLDEYKGIKAIAIKNENTGLELKVSTITSYNPSENAGYIPNHPVSEADDAIIKYEGITIKRPSNEIDDIVPEIKLSIHEKTDKTATISVKADTEASKEALIQFVGKYNQAVAKLNVLSQTKNEIIEELDYLTDDEKEKMREQLGMFQTDFSLSSIKGNMQSILAAGYSFSDDASVTMLSQIGIGTNASGFSGTYSQSRLRGYLEIDEKKLDSALESNLDDIKNMFGYDTDGDLIIDSGIAFKLDKQLTAYTQTGGILALKTSTLDTKIKSSESRISKLEEQMDDKEAELRAKYSTMEGSLNSLESQQSAISNFTKQNNQQ